jgi:putative ABC transport system permease protein
VQLVGLDNASMVGRPARMLAGRVEDLRLPNAVIIDELAVQRLSRGRPRPIGVGDSFEMNDREARVVGVARTEMSFFGYPYIFSTYEQALQFAPRTRKMLSYILVQPDERLAPAAVAARIRAETGLGAYTEQEFGRATVRWFFANTGIPTSFGMTILLGFIVGVAVAGQTFYSFVLENLRHFGALKAMGAGDGLLTRMVLLQAFSVGLIGYGIGLGLTVAIGALFLEKGMPPFELPWQLPVATLAAILLICALASWFGIRRIRALEPAVVFRG